MINLQLDIIRIRINIVINIVTPESTESFSYVAETFRCLNCVSTVRA